MITIKIWVKINSSRINSRRLFCPSFIAFVYFSRNIPHYNIQGFVSSVSVFIGLRFINRQTTEDSGLNISTAGVNRLPTISGTRIGTDTAASEKHYTASEASTLISAMNIEKNAELRITKLIAIKHMLDLIKPLYDALKGTSTTLLTTYREVSIQFRMQLSLF